MKKTTLLSFILIFSCFLLFTCTEKSENSKILLNVSYDPTREMYQEFNQIFGQYWFEKNNEKIEFRQSHGGSGKQARAVIDGLEADLVTLALAYDIDEIAKRSNRIPSNWQTKFPNNSCPYSSVIVFLVRKGNPKNIFDWNDLIRENISVITPNPKTSGGARWNYLAAWAYADNLYGGDINKIKEFLKILFRNVPVLDSGARGSTNTFVQRGIGDVLLAWENEALLITEKIDKNNFEIIIPSVSIKAEPPVAVVELNARSRGNYDLAVEYLNYLYTQDAQKILAKYYFRPSDESVLSEFKHQFPTLNLVDINTAFGGWEKAQTAHFKDGGYFDEIYNIK